MDKKKSKYKQNSNNKSSKGKSKEIIEIIRDNEDVGEVSSISTKPIALRLDLNSLEYLRNVIEFEDLDLVDMVVLAKHVAKLSWAKDQGSRTITKQSEDAHLVLDETNAVVSSQQMKENPQETKELQWNGILVKPKFLKA